MDESYRQGPSLLGSLWRHRYVVVAVPLLAGLLGYFLANQQIPIYESSATLLLTDPARTPGLDDNVRINPEEFIPQQAARASAREVFVAAQEALDTPPSLQEMMDNVSMQQSSEDLSLTITAASSDPDQAAAIANALATSFMANNEQDQREGADRAVFELEQQAADLETRLAELEGQFGADPQNFAVQSQIQNLSLRLIDLQGLISSVRSNAELRGDGVDVFEQAQVPRGPSSPQPLIQAILFAFFGGVVASLWAYWQAGRSHRVLRRTDPEQVLGVPLLGEVPLFKSGPKNAPVVLEPEPAVAAAYEFVLSSIEFALGDVGGKSVMITSALPAEGKTTTALQLVIAASMDRRRVVLVDADVRAHGLTRALGADDRSGLSDLVISDVRLADVMRQYRVNDDAQIPVVTAGQHRGDPAALLRTQSFRRTMNSIKKVTELMVVDTSPLLAVADATIVASSVDGMVIVVNHGTPFSELEKVRERLNFVSTPLIGYIYNRSDATTAPAYGYQYGALADDKRRLSLGTKFWHRRNGNRSQLESPPTNLDGEGESSDVDVLASPGRAGDDAA